MVFNEDLRGSSQSMTSMCNENLLHLHSAAVESGVKEHPVLVTDAIIKNVNQK